MRITSILNRQHNGFMFHRHWHVAKNRKVRDTGVASSLKLKGVEVTDPQQYMKYEREKEKFFVLRKSEPSKDENHPDFKSRPLFIFNDSNVLLEGVKQAQVLLKTLVFDKFPEKIAESFENLKLPADIERSMQQSVLVSHLLDAEQAKLEKLKDPTRPMWNYPRVYGITDSRKNLLLSTRFLNHCERFQGHIRSQDRKRVNDAFFIAPFKSLDEHVQLEVTAETFMTSRKPIQPFNIKLSSEDDVLPDIFPIKPTISIPQFNFYNETCVYPIKNLNFSNPHTIFLNYSNQLTKNLYEKPVTDTQFESRAILKGFAVAASRAQTMYGEGCKQLDKPIPVQVVQFDGKKIQFGIFQLNTLDLEGAEGIKNYWFSSPITKLYDDCHYEKGRPSLTAYNFDIFKMMNVFYSS